MCGQKSTRPNFKEIKEQMSKRPQINKGEKHEALENRGFKHACTLVGSPGVTLQDKTGAECSRRKKLGSDNFRENLIREI